MPSQQNSSNKNKKRQDKQNNLGEKELFRFISENYAEDAFIVTKFKGHEGMSELYDFEITLVTQLTDEDERKADTAQDDGQTNQESSEENQSTLCDSLLIHPAVFIIKNPDLINTANESDYDNITADGSTYPDLFAKIKGSFKDTKNAFFYGYPVSCSLVAKNGDWTFYTVRLRPVCDKLNHLTQNTVFTDKTVVDIVKNILDNTETFSIDYTFDSVTTTFQNQEFSLQHNETFFEYMSAKLEYDGIYYFYSKDSKLEQLIFMDNKLKHEENSDAPTLKYQATTSSQDKDKGNIATTFTEVRTAVPHKVFLRDYDWSSPNTPIEASAIISDKGLGEVYLFGEGFSTEKDGTHLATLRAQEILCQSYQYIGTTCVPNLRPGYFFTMEEHYVDRLNDEYLITEVSHSGSQEGLVSSILATVIGNATDSVYYHNSFTSIPSSVQYRPKRKAQRATVSGLITGFVTSTQSDKTKVDLDDFGRYKVVFPQSIAQSGTANSSCWLRRAQPSVGPSTGSTFPIYPGTEVLVGFTNGHPDKPIIISPVNNAETGFSGQESTGFSGIFNNEITLNANGLTLAQSGAGETTTTDQDKLLSYNNISKMVNGLDSGFATLSSTAAASYATLMSANTDPALLALKLAGPAVTALGQAMSASEAEKNILGTMGLATETIGKLLPLAFTITSKAKAHIKGACGYQTSISSSPNACTVALEAELNTKSLVMIIGSMLAHISSSIASCGMTISNLDEDIEDYNNQIAEATTPDEKKQLETEKDLLIAARVMPDAATFISENVALAILSYTKMMQNLKPRGGVSVTSADKNLVLGAANEARLTSGKQVFIGANTGLNAMSTLQLKDMFDKTNSPAWGNGNPCADNLVPPDERVAIVSKHVLNGAEKVNRMISLDEIAINSANKISLTNQSQNNIIVQTEPLINVVAGKVGVGAAAVDRIPSPAIIKTQYPYSEILMDNTGLAADQILFSAHAFTEEAKESRLDFHKNKVLLQYQNKLNQLGKLTFDSTSTTLAYNGSEAANKQTSLKLENATVVLAAQDTKISLNNNDGDTSKSVTIQVDPTTKFVLNKGNGITLNGSTLKSAIQKEASIKADKTLTLEGSNTSLSLSTNAFTIGNAVKFKSNLLQLM